MALDLDAWLRTNVGHVLRGRGFHGGPRRFSRRKDDFCTVVQFQGSVGNLDGQLRFVVNLGVWSRIVAEASGSTSTRCPPASDCHICLRLGELSERAEVWWDIGQASDREVT